MKKIVAVLALFLAFTMSSNAQEAKVSPEVAGRAQAIELIKYLNLGGKEAGELNRLFVMKAKTFANANLAPEKKAVYSQSIAKKLAATLTPPQMQKLQANQELYN